MATAAAINNLGGYAHNPRGNLWYNDESSFGHKLLLKMGWSKGKGLGKKEDGIKENLKVKFKNTNSGLGYKNDSYTNVMKTEYESILKSIVTENSQPKTDNGINEIGTHKNKSLKQKSRLGRSRIRYPKLYYGKDISKYSEKDMKSIFICSSTYNNIEERMKDSESSNKKESECQSSKSFETYNGGLSIPDYFNAKRKEKKNCEQEEKLYKNPKVQKTEFENTENETVNVLCSKRKRKNSEMHNNKDERDLTPFHARERENVAAIKKEKKSSENSISGRDFSDDELWRMSSAIYSQKPNKKRKKSDIKENPLTAANSDELSGKIDIYSDAAMPSKKRKKSHGINGASIDSVVLLSSNSLSQKDEKLVNDIDTVNNLPSLDSVEVESLSKKKKLKNKLQSLKFKSCLRSKSNKYSVKQVSFNEDVSYRIFDSYSYSDSDFESVNPLPDDNIVQIDLTTGISDNIDENETDSYNGISTVEDVNFKELNGSTGACTNEVVEKMKKEELEEEGCSLSSLPSSKSSHFNCWVESQKQALKMSMYKSILSGIKKHDVLKTTNLAFLKGYGNWGF